ncbi:hypothetical protein D3C73_1190470 [compost metagenome]
MSRSIRGIAVAEAAFRLRQVAKEGLCFVGQLPGSVCGVVPLLLGFHKSAVLDDVIFAFNPPGEHLLPVFLDQRIEQLNDFHRVFGVDADAEAVVQVQRRSIAVVVLGGAIIYKRKAYISAFDFALSRQ